jgi:multidrug resistance efflux pump
VSVDELQAQLAQAKAKLRAAQAQRQKVATGTRSEQIAVYRAQLEEVRTSIDSQTAQLSQMTENVYTVADEAVHGVADRFFDNPGGVPDLRLPPRGVDDDTLESLRDTLNSRFAKWQQHRTESTAERANRVRALLTETGELLALLASIANRNDVRVAPDKLEALSGARERVANAQTSLAKSQTALSGAQTKHAVAKRQLALAKAGSRSEDISATAANEDEVRAKIHELRERIAGATITAPYSGVITDVSIERGELAKSGSPVLTIADHSSWLVRGEAASRLAPALNEGQSVTITPAGYARSFTGELATVMPALDGQSGALVLEARTAALPDTVKEGQAVSMSVPLTLQGSSHYFVPRAFVGFSYDGPFVETVDGQRHVVDVQSSTDDTYTIGVSDLRASTTIIVP